MSADVALLVTRMTIVVRPAASRFRTRLGWLDSRHSFNFGEHFRPDDKGHGLLLVSNDDVVAPATGFGTHGHRDMEIVTWVISGQLEHQDSEGNHGLLYPGLAQRMSAGRGIRHSEMNPHATEPVRFIQMWVPPDTLGIDPSYEQRDINDALAGGHLTAIASGQGHDGAIVLHQSGAVLYGARLTPGLSVEVPGAPYVHLFVATGAGTISDISLETGDAARLSAHGTATYLATTDTEVLIWATQ